MKVKRSDTVALCCHVGRTETRQVCRVSVFRADLGFEFCPSVLERVGLRVPASYLRNSVRNRLLLDMLQLLFLSPGTLIQVKRKGFISIIFRKTFSKDCISLTDITSVVLT